MVFLGLSSFYGFHLNMDFSLRVATYCGSTGIVNLDYMQESICILFLYMNIKHSLPVLLIAGTDSAA